MARCVRAGRSCAFHCLAGRVFDAEAADVQCGKEFDQRQPELGTQFEDLTGSAVKSDQGVAVNVEYLVAAHLHCRGHLLVVDGEGF